MAPTSGFRCAMWAVEEELKGPPPPPRLPPSTPRVQGPKPRAMPSVRKGKTPETILAGMGTDLKVVIDIDNQSPYTLYNPSCYMESGIVRYPPQSEIKPMEMRACGFRKHKLGLLGCVGMVCYQFVGKSTTLSVRFSNPFSNVLFDRSLAMMLNKDTSASAYLLSILDGCVDKVFCWGCDRSLTVSDLELKVEANMIDKRQCIIRFVIR